MIRAGKSFPIKKGDDRVCKSVNGAEWMWRNAAEAESGTRRRGIGIFFYYFIEKGGEGRGGGIRNIVTIECF